MWQKINKRCFSLDTARIDSSRLFSITICVFDWKISKSVSLLRRMREKKKVFFFKKIILVPYRDICFILRNINSYIKVVVIVDFTEYVRRWRRKMEKHTRTQFLRKVCFLFMSFQKSRNPVHVFNKSLLLVLPYFSTLYLLLG